jgi:hypothetical protein
VEHIFCPRCRLRQPSDHAFCVRCGASLPAFLLRAASPKAVRFFAGIKVSDGDPEGAFLRVSSYRRDQVIESPEGSVTIPGHHVRFSIWIGEEARCVVSIPETEARELVRFLTGELGELRDLDAIS